MDIVISALTLTTPGGMQTYLLTIAPALERLGHEVTLYSPELGQMAEVARQRGLRVAPSENALPAHCNAVIALDASTLLTMAERYPTATRVLIVHSAEYDIHMPSGLQGAVSVAVAMNDAVTRRLEAFAIQVPIVRLHQPIDTERHQSTGVQSSTPQRVLMLGNYLKSEQRALIAQACDAANVSWQQVGVHGQLLVDPLPAINSADIVIGQGRSVLDAMACGRAVWVYGPVAGDGWVTADNYGRLEADGFRGRATDQTVGAEDFAAALDQYTPAMGATNRHLITLHHSAYEHAIGLIDAINLSPAAAPVAGPLREVARLIRTQHDAQSTVDFFTRELRTATAQLTDARGQIRHLERRLEILLGSRRWRTASLAAAALQQLRHPQRPRSSVNTAPPAPPSEGGASEG